MPKQEFPFVHNSALDLYQYDWKTLDNAQYKGKWTISYFKDYGTPNQLLLQGPEAQVAGNLYTMRVTGE